MKKIFLSLLISISGISLADTPTIDISIPTSPIVIQRANDSGIVFNSNNSMYQLILGGQAVVNQGNNSVNSSYKNSWTAQNGPFQLSIPSSAANNSALLTNSNFYQIAYNQSTGRVGIIIGDIVAKLKPHYNALAIANNYNLSLSSHFERINIAIFQVKPGQDIFTITNSLRNHPGVDSVEIDVVENLNMPN